MSNLKRKELRGSKKICPIDHSDTLKLTLVRQSDGTSYEKCGNCGWIKPYISCGKPNIKDNLVEIDKRGNVWLNFDKPVGIILLKKIIEILEIIEKDEIDKDYD